jgi:hypothetical protein
VTVTALARPPRRRSVTRAGRPIGITTACDHGVIRLHMTSALYEACLGPQNDFSRNDGGVEEHAAIWSGPHLAATLWARATAGETGAPPTWGIVDVGIRRTQAPCTRALLTSAWWAHQQLLAVPKDSHPLSAWGVKEEAQRSPEVEQPRSHLELVW